MKRKLKYAGIRAKKMLFMMLDQFSDPFYQGVAAQIAFSLFLSIAVSYTHLDVYKRQPFQHHS